MSFPETTLLLSSKLSRDRGDLTGCHRILYNLLYCISHIVATCGDSPRSHVQLLSLRGSALAAATDGDPVLGKQAILALMEAVSEANSALSSFAADN